MKELKHHRPIWFEKGAQGCYHVWRFGECYGTVAKYSSGRWYGYTSLRHGEDSITVGNSHGLKTRNAAGLLLYRYSRG